MSRQSVGVSLLLGVIVAAVLCNGAEPPQAVMPPAAAGILTQMDKEIAASKLKAIIALEKVLKDTTKKGDLAGAVALKEVIDELKADTQPVQGGRAGGGRVDGRSIVGTWNNGSHNVEILADGSCTSAGHKASWRLDGRTVEIIWPFNQTHRLTITPEGLVGDAFDKAGNKLSEVRLTRVP